ncbi:A/G-specific adenine glycosylase [Sungkyunkwania multivorans]
MHKRPLPWRETQDPYKIWLSEIMLQQTRVEQGMPYYFKFLEAFPSVHDLANATEGEVLKLWQGLGYYSRARNLHETAKHVSKSLNGQFPRTYKELIKLKGVGDYTASAIASICFNEATPVVDGNVYRVLSRYYGIRTPINSTSGIKEFKALAEELIDKERPATFNQAIMEFGAIQCKPQNPYCLHCPLNDSCMALATSKVKELPIKLKKGKIKRRFFNYLVMISDDDETQLQQRTKKGIWQHLYEFPLIEAEKKLSKKELLELQGFKDLVKDNNFKVSLYNDEEVIHKLSHQHLHTQFWIVLVNEIKKGAIPISNIKKYPVPILIDNFVEEFNF